ncbi:sensor domain-containing phosphodiesterase [Jidongwangia harbinensis]|uniref:sensor domain-containing phosphodiesterase n=1 Tax=Jidongwangia harbinensis TaxID=2878561 RepID=UPI001CD94D4A|nr:EAL domain-containing protein [Jidongwangia harbinensis]MCA2212068.1 EAL domain-containing protein [Jidongwangia harbinensis]
MHDIHELVDRRAVTAVFQPLVDIATGRVVGYEALSRGPAGTPYESPMQMFAAARAAGRDGELDWVCRAAAYRAAREADLDPTLTLFVNMEPRAWRAPCPADLIPAVEHARHRLRVVTEMTERAIAEDPAALLSATANCRTAGWGVALDDVGADPMSLALMPFVHPDVVKLDMQLLRRPDDPYTARVVAAVSAYAESSGAVVLAEGIETAEHLLTARTMGATVGQGWHYGRPQPLPAATPPSARLPLLGTPAVAPGTRTPFAVVSERRPVTRTTKAALMPLSRHLEALAGEGPEPPVLLACFQESRHFTPATMRRFARIAEHSPLVAALGVGLDAEPMPGIRGAGLGTADPLRGEWNVIVVGPHQAAALVAHDLGDTGPEPERRFDFAVTHDRALVIEAARALLGWLAPVRSEALAGLVPA